MFDIDKWQEIWNTIRKNKLRTALTAFGVAWGIFILFYCLAVVRDSKKGIEGQFNVAKNAIFLWSQRTSIAYKGMKPGRFIRFNNADVEALRQNIPELDVIAPRLQLDGSFSVVRNQKSASFEVYGDYPDYFKVQPFITLQGRLINQKDILEKRKVAVIGETVRSVLFGEIDPLGKYIKIKGVPFMVIGVFKMRSTRAEEVMYNSKQIFVSNTALQQAFNLVNKIGWFAFVPHKGYSTSMVQKK